METATEGDQVQKIAMLPRSGVGPFSGGTLAIVRAAQADEQAAAARVGDIADQPIAALAMTIGEVVPADRLGNAREAASQVRGA
jgi:hypothetical protein